MGLESGSNYYEYKHNAEDHSYDLESNDIGFFEIETNNAENRKYIFDTFQNNSEQMLGFMKMNTLLTNGIYPMCQNGVSINNESKRFLDKIIDELITEARKIHEVYSDSFVIALERVKFSKMDANTFETLDADFFDFMTDIEDLNYEEDEDNLDTNETPEYDEKLNLGYILRASFPPKMILEGLKKQMLENKDNKFRDYILGLDENDPNLGSNDKIYAIVLYMSSLEVSKSFSLENRKKSQEVIKQMETIIANNQNEFDMSEVVNLSTKVIKFGFRDIGFLKESLKNAEGFNKDIIKQQIASVKLEKYGKVDLKNLNLVSEEKYSKSQYIRSREMRYGFKSSKNDQPLLKLLLENIDEDTNDIEMMPECMVIEYIIDFQKNNGLKPDGLFGPNTYNKILEVSGVEVEFSPNYKPKQVYHKS